MKNKYLYSTEGIASLAVVLVSIIGVIFVSIVAIDIYKNGDKTFSFIFIPFILLICLSIYKIIKCLYENN